VAEEERAQKDQTARADREASLQARNTAVVARSLQDPVHQHSEKTNNQCRTILRTLKGGFISLGASVQNSKGKATPSITDGKNPHYYVRDLFGFPWICPTGNITGS